MRACRFLAAFAACQITLSHYFVSTLAGGRTTILSIQNLTLASVQRNYAVILLLLALQGVYLVLLGWTYLKVHGRLGRGQQNRYADVLEATPVTELLAAVTDFVLSTYHRQESIAFHNPLHGDGRAHGGQREDWGQVSLGILMTLSRQSAQTRKGRLGM